jgi:serine/threonine protein kinase
MEKLQTSGVIKVNSVTLNRWVVISQKVNYWGLHVSGEKEHPTKAMLVYFNEALKLCSETEEVREQSVTPEEAQELRRAFGDYRISGLINRGGFGLVLEAIHRRTRRRMAVKVVSSAHRGNATSLARFEREAALCRSLAHPHIIQVHESGVRRGVPFLVMDLVAGVDLAQVSQAEGRLDCADVAEIGRQSACGLAAAQAAGILHRDVKPGNLMLVRGAGEPPCVKVLDFGLAAMAERVEENVSFTMGGDVLGTMEFMAPEQVDGERGRGAADVFGLGAVLFKLLTGEQLRALPEGPLSVAQRLQVVSRGEIRKCAVMRPDMDPALAVLVDRMVSREPVDRPSWPEILTGLETAAAGHELEKLLDRVPARTPLPLPPAPRRYGWWIFSAAAALAVMGWLLARPKPYQPEKMPLPLSQGQPSAKEMAALGVAEAPKIVAANWKWLRSHAVAGDPAAVSLTCRRWLGEAIQSSEAGVNLARTDEQPPPVMTGTGLGAVAWMDAQDVLVRIAPGRLVLRDLIPQPSHILADGMEVKVELPAPLRDGVALAFPPLDFVREHPGYRDQTGTMIAGGAVWRIDPLAGDGAPVRLGRKEWPQGEPVGVAYTSKALYLIVRPAGRVRALPTVPEDFEARLYVWKDGAFQSCRTSLPMPDPAALAADPATGDLYVSCGARLGEDPAARCVLRLRPEGPIYNSEILLTALAGPLVNGLTFSPQKGRVLVVDRARGGAVVHVIEGANKAPEGTPPPSQVRWEWWVKERRASIHCLPRLVSLAWRVDYAGALQQRGALSLWSAPGPSSPRLYGYMAEGLCMMYPPANVRFSIANGAAPLTMAASADGAFLTWVDRSAANTVQFVPCQVSDDLSRYDMAKPDFAAVGRSFVLGKQATLHGHAPQEPEFRGLAMPPRLWKGDPSFTATCGLAANGSRVGGGVWRFDLSKPEEGLTQIGTPLEGQEIVDVAFTEGDAWALCRQMGQPPEGAEFTHRLLRWQDGQWQPCRTDMPLADPCAVTADPDPSRPGSLFVLTGAGPDFDARNPQRHERRLLHLRPAGDGSFKVEVIAEGFGHPLIGGLDAVWADNMVALLVSDRSDPQFWFALCPVDRKIQWR